MQFPKILMRHYRLDVKQMNGSITNAQMFGHQYSLENAM